VAKQVAVPDGVKIDDSNHFVEFRKLGDEPLTVIHRQQGTVFTPMATGGAPSAYIDEVLLSNDFTAHQCRLCGRAFDRAPSANAHVSMHSPNRVRGPGSLKKLREQRAADARSGVKALRRKPMLTSPVLNTKETTPMPEPKLAEPRRNITKITTKATADAVRQVRAMREQLLHMATGLDVIQTRLLEFDRAVNDNDVDVEELQEQVRTLTELAESNQTDAEKYRTIKGMMS